MSKSLDLRPTATRAVPAQPVPPGLTLSHHGLTLSEAPAVVAVRESIRAVSTWADRHPVAAGATLAAVILGTIALRRLAPPHAA